MPPTLHGPRVLLRPGRPDDRAALADMFATPEVSRWWPQPSDEDLAAYLQNADPGTDAWVIEVAGLAVGLILGYEEHDPEYRHGGIDIALHPDVHGRGLGPEAIRVLARHLFEERGHHRIVIDPNAANARAIHVYEALGFRRVGVMRQYEWSAADGRWTDGLLMDLLRGELTSSEPASAAPEG